MKQKIGKLNTANMNKRILNTANIIEMRKYSLCETSAGKSAAQS
jgi:hypothetical protein